jgi:hypothetical protein
MFKIYGIKGKGKGLVYYSVTPTESASHFDF